MALVACTECETEISDKAKACPSCGSPRRKGPSGAGKLLGWAAVALFGVFALYYVVAANDPNLQQKMRERGAYEQCLVVKRDNPGNSFAREACEYMKEEYVKKYGREP